MTIGYFSASHQRSTVMQIVVAVWGIVLGLLAACPAGTDGENPSGKTESREPSPAVGISPDSPKAKAAQMLIEEEQRLAETLLREFPKRPEPLMLLGNVQRRRGNSAQAVEYWNRSLAIDPGQAEVYQNLGILAFEKDDFQKAAEMWQKALTLKPDLAGIRNQLGDALMRQGRTDEAVGILEEELKWNPKSAATHYFLGRCHLQLQQLERARVYYEKTILQDPDYTNAYYGLSTLCARLKETEKSREYLEKFRKQKAKDDEATAQRDRLDYDTNSSRLGLLEMSRHGGMLYLSAGQSDKAESLLKRGLELDPNDIGCLERMALVYQSQGRIPDSLKFLTKSRDVQPDNPLVYLNLGSVYSRLKRFEDAESAYRRVIVLIPQSAKGHFELAKLYLRAGRKQPEALGLILEAVHLEPDAEKYRILSWAWDVNGNRQEAIAAIERAVELAPNNPQYRQIREQLIGRMK